MQIFSIKNAFVYRQHENYSDLYKPGPRHWFYPENKNIAEGARSLPLPVGDKLNM